MTEAGAVGSNAAHRKMRVLKPLATVLVALVVLYILGSSPACQGRDQGPGPIELRDGCYMYYDANDDREHIVCP